MARSDAPSRPTREALLALPEHERGELIEGVLGPKEARSGRHGGAQLGVGAFVRGAFGRGAGGPPERPGGWWFATEVLVELSPETIVRPDVAGWRRERLVALPHEVPVAVRPDWICEVLSPTNASHDTVRKLRLYRRAEIPHYWIVDPIAESLTVYRWTEAGYLHVLGATVEERIHAPPFEAVELAVAALFGDEGR